MIKKTPKSEVYIPKALKALKKERRKKRKGRTFFREIEPLEAKLEIASVFWENYIKQEFGLELVPKIYRYLLNNPSSKTIIFTDGDTFIKAKSSKDDKTVTMVEARRRRRISEKEAVLKGMIWICTTHILTVDKRKHFLKRLIERKFDLTLIVAFYEVAIGKMPSDTIIISDHTTKIIGHKSSGASVVLNTGMVIGEIDWDDYLDVKF
jgi:hypothetical protein